MKIRVWCQTDVGLRRENNQDSYLFDEAIGIYMVADGMGGHQGGEVASAMAVQTLKEVLQKAQKDQRKPNPRWVLDEAYAEASRRIFDRSRAQSELEGMGTTMVSVYFSEGDAFIANVGDSRAYLYTRPFLWQLTEDHSLINEQVRAGVIRREDQNQAVGRNVITRSVGFEREVRCDIIQKAVKSGDTFLLCSDGLSSLVPDDKILDILNGYSIETCVSKLIDEAKARGGDDNVTVMLAKAD